MLSVDDWEPTEEDLAVWDQFFETLLRLAEKAKESQDSFPATSPEPEQPDPADQNR